MFGHTMFGFTTVELIGLNSYLLYLLVPIFFAKICYCFFVGNERLLIVETVLLMSDIWLCKQIPEFLAGYLNTFNGIFGNELHNFLLTGSAAALLGLIIYELSVMYNGLRENCYL